ncbi:MAG: flagellar biosynthetic protein FliO [Aquisalinus sp.]|nr:flagellar biosynthetic protein FliO [Aquisalinus sp.]
MSTLDMVLKTLMTLGVTGAVILLAFVVLKLLQKFQLKLTAPADGPGLVFERSIPVGQKERITVVRYGAERLVLGITPGGISLLKTLEIEAEEQLAESTVVETPREIAQFKDILGKMKLSKTG